MNIFSPDSYSYFYSYTPIYELASIPQIDAFYLQLIIDNLNLSIEINGVDKRFLSVSIL